MQEGAKLEAAVLDTKAKPLPFIQGEREIQIKAKVVQSQEEKLLMFKVKAEEVKYLVTRKYIDGSNYMFGKRNTMVIKVFRD